MTCRFKAQPVEFSHNESRQILICMYYDMVQAGRCLISECYSDGSITDQDPGTFVYDIDGLLSNHLSDYQSIDSVVKEYAGETTEYNKGLTFAHIASWMISARLKAREAVKEIHCKGIL